jgi:hypothetical protein
MVPRQILRSTSPFGGKLVPFSSQTGCAAPLVGAKNRPAYAAGSGRGNDAQGGSNVDELDAARQRSSRTRSFERSSVKAWLRKPILRHAQLTDLDGAWECNHSLRDARRSTFRAQDRGRVPK